MGDVAQSILNTGLVSWGLKLYEYRHQLLSHPAVILVAKRKGRPLCCRCLSFQSAGMPSLHLLARQRPIGLPAHLFKRKENSSSSHRATISKFDSRCWSFGQTRLPVSLVAACPLRFPLARTVIHSVSFARTRPADDSLCLNALNKANLPSQIKQIKAPR